MSNPSTPTHDALSLSGQKTHRSDTPIRSHNNPERQCKQQRSCRSLTTAFQCGSSSDRFIPNRRAMDIDLARFTLNFNSRKSVARVPSHENSQSLHKQIITFYYRRLLSASLFGPTFRDGARSDLIEDSLPASRVLSLNDGPLSTRNVINSNREKKLGLFPSAVQGKKCNRKIPMTSEKILDAPGMKLDFYLNLLDWSSSNILAVGLDNAVYLWDASAGSIDELCKTRTGDSIASVSWMSNEEILAIGTDNGEIWIFDGKRGIRLRTMRSHRSRVASLSWNGSSLSSGSIEGEIHNHNVSIVRHHVATLASHTSEVCGLQWSPDGSQLASGGKDNVVYIWDPQNGSEWTPKHRLEHFAPVKALSWCPWQINVLATGGGASDPNVRLWNTDRGICIKRVNTNSQVCAILWSSHLKEFVTGHGYAQNQLTVWEYPSMTRIAELKEHSASVLHMSLSPDGQTVVSASADETLRFWKIFPEYNHDLEQHSNHGWRPRKLPYGISLDIR